MKYFSLLPLAALASALVVPDEQVLADLSIEANHRAAHVQEDTAWTKDDILASFNKHSKYISCLLYTSPSPRDGLLSRMPSSA